MGFLFRSLGFEGSNVQGSSRKGLPRLSWILNNLPCLRISMRKLKQAGQKSRPC